MYDNFEWDDLVDGSFWEQNDPIVMPAVRGGELVKLVIPQFSPEATDIEWNEDWHRAVDLLNPELSASGHDPELTTRESDDYIDFGYGPMWAHGIYQTDDNVTTVTEEWLDGSVETFKCRDLRDTRKEGGIIGAYNQYEKERRDLDLLLDPGARKLRDRRRIHREGHDYNDRKLGEQINRDRVEAGEEMLDSIDLQIQVASRRTITDFQLWIQECGGHKGKAVGQRRAQQLLKEIEEIDDDEERNTHPLVIGFAAAREAGWLSRREQAQLEPVSKWAAHSGTGREQYDPTSDKYSERQLESIASQLIKHDGDVSKVIVEPDEPEDEYIDPDAKQRERELIERLTEEFLMKGGSITQVESAEDQLKRRNPELHRRLKYRWLRWSRW